MLGRAGLKNRWRVRPVTVLVAFALFAATAAAAWATHIVVRDQESRLLSERANEVSLVLSTSLDQLAPSLSSLGEVLRVTNGSTTAFDAAANDATTTSTNPTTYALLSPDGSAWITIAATGSSLHPGQIVTGPRAATLTAASHTPDLVATPVLGTGAQRLIGFALRTNPTGNQVLYRQAALGPISQPRQAATAPFHEVQVVLYASPTPQPNQILVATTTQVRHGPVRYQPLALGASHWLLAVTATQPLVGSVAAAAPWVALAFGIVATLLIAALVDLEGRRRTTAMSLYAGEHHIAETLQRSLLPELPNLPGLQLAARYQPGGDHQQVGGDWFDVFEISGQHVGIVIGDVVGHDITAAAAMSQIRSALRAYAWQGAQPADVLSQLDRLVEAFNIAELLTVFYGVLTPVDANGQRTFHYANAGHIYPLLRSPQGQVELLNDGRSTLIGALHHTPREQAQRTLEPGTLLVCYTDGLVETPHTSLDQSMEQLRTSLTAATPTTTLETICDHILQAIPQPTHRDDIAILAIRTNPQTTHPPTPHQTTTQQPTET